MLKRLLLAASLLLPASSLVAQTPQVPISALPPATTPLGGTEQVPIVQAGVTRRVSANQFPIIAPTTISIGGVLAGTAPANQVMYGIAAGTGVPLFEQLSFANLSGLIAASQIPAPTASAFGGILAATAPTNQFQTGNTAGVPTFAQPSFANLSGQIAASQVPPTMGPTVNGISCPVTGTCSITAAAAGIAVGTTGVTGGSTNGPLINNAGVLGNLPTLASGVYVTNASGVPSISTTLPSGLTIPSPALSGTVTGNATIPNAVLVNSTISGVALGSNLGALTFGTHVTGTSYNGSAAVTLGLDATNANTPSTIVSRDASGNFAAGTISAALTGLASLNLPLAGGTMSGAIAMGGNALSGVSSVSTAALTDTGLATQGTACNNASGAFSTSATGCPGTVQSVATGGTGTGTAGGAAVDNISAFGGTGLMRRTGSAAYTFGTTTSLAEGGTGQTTAAAARTASGLNIDDLCTFGDANYTVLSTCRQVQIPKGTTFTAPRTMTLPATSSINGGARVAFKDAAGAIGATNTLTIARQGSDLINGGTSQTLTTAYAGADFDPDGNNGTWTYTASSSGGGSGIASITAGPGLSATGGPAGGTVTTSGAIQIADQQRRNQIIDMINMAKVLGNAQRYLNSFSDGFSNTDGTTVTGGTINPASKNATPTFTAGSNTVTTMTSDSSSGQVASASSELNTTTYGAWNAFDNDGGSTDFYTASGGNTGGWLQLQFTSGAKSIGSYSVTSASDSTGTLRTPSAWTFAGCTGNGTGCTTLDTQTGQIFTTVSTTRSYTLSGGTASYAYYRLTWTAVQSGSDSYGGMGELQLLAPGVYSNVTLLSNAQTADATVANARAAIILNASASPTWGTTDTLEVSTNGGTNWTAVTPVAGGVVQAGTSQTGGQIYESPDTATTSGTSFQARYKTLTNTSRTIFGLSTTVH